MVSNHRSCWMGMFGGRAILCLQYGYPNPYLFWIASIYNNFPDIVYELCNRPENERQIMSEESKEIALIPIADFTVKDLETIQKFRDDGMLGLHTLKENDCERAMALYLDGKSYRQIASVIEIKKEVILFLSHKFKWFEMRKEYLEELQATMKDKIMEAKLSDQEFLMHLSLAYKKKISKNINKYLKTDESQFSDKFDSKDVSTWLKISDMLHSISSENIGKPSDKSLVGLNGLGEGVTITKTGTNSVEITPKSPFSTKLQAFANFKREQENPPKEPEKPIHDITNETINKESEDKNEAK